MPFFDVASIERLGLWRLAGRANRLALGVNPQASKGPHWAGKGHALIYSFRSSGPFF